MRIRPYDPSRPRKATTPAQDAARERSFRIFRLRGLWFNAWLLTGERQDAMQAAIDQELELIGAEPQGPRWAAHRADMDALLDQTTAEFEEVQP